MAQTNDAIPPFYQAHVCLLLVGKLKVDLLQNEEISLLVKNKNLCQVTYSQLEVYSLTQPLPNPEGSVLVGRKAESILDFDRCLQSGAGSFTGKVAPPACFARCPKRIDGI